VITLLTLGGTIAMTGHRDGVVTRLSGADLTAAVPGLTIPVDVRDVRGVPSASLTFADILQVLDLGSAAIAGGSAGVVVSQGTDTLEETAYLLDLLWPHPEPIVVTGAMRNPTLAGIDGPANLLAAVRTAASPLAHGLGALVVLNDEIHLAVRVRKTHSTSTATFASPDSGPAGAVIEGSVRMFTRPVTRHPALPVPPAEVLESTVVPLHTATLDDDGTLLHHLASGSTAAGGSSPAQRASAGLVVSAFGVGHMPEALTPVLETIAHRMPVVLCSRTGAGSVLRETYGAVGSEKDLQRRGLINGRMLHPYKARVLLRVLLALGGDHGAVEAAFAARG
jgi:L-asparaginase/Glu-tRNA(Gln) amidotransferase subunit D